jgi:hypothetical protein
MTESAGLERGYRRLLAVYPQSFRREHEDEMLGVLMACAGPGQRRPRLAEAVDVIRGALGMRLRRAVGPAGREAWADALMLISLAAPVLVVMAAVLEIALPYHLAPQDRTPYLYELGGPSLLSLPGFDVIVGSQVIIAVAVLLGWRRLALLAAVVAAVLFAPAANYGSPIPLSALTGTAVLLELVALTGPPGGREIRWLLRWREGATLLLAAAAIELLTVMSSMSSDQAQIGIRLRPGAWKMLPSPSIRGYVAAVLVLTIAAVGLALMFAIGRYFLLLAAMCYPVVMELIQAVRTRTDMVESLPGGHYILLFVPSVLLLAAIMTCSHRLAFGWHRGRRLSS